MKIGYFFGHFLYKDFFGDSRQYMKRYSHDGGVIVAHDLALNMASRNNEIHIFTTSISSKDSIEKYKNITIYRYGTIFKIESHNISFNLLQEPINHRVNIIHAHGGNYIAELAALRYVKRKKVPFALTYTQDSQKNYGGIVRRLGVSFYIKYLLDRVLSSADVIISPSECYIGKSRFLGKYKNKIVVIPNGINIKDFDIPYSKVECRSRLGLPVDANIILFVGNLSPHKGPRVLVTAMPSIMKEVPNPRLIFVGNGGMREELQTLSRKLGIEKYVEFVGFIGDTWKKALYFKSADVFVNPSFSESFGMVNLEAMACSVSIVAFKVGGVPDVVKDGENGILVQPRDYDALANSIIYLLENEAIQRKMGENGRRRVEDYSWDTIAEKTERVYKLVLGK